MPQPLKDQLIEQAPGPVLGMWALDDPINTTIPALTYPEVQDPSVALTQVGAINYQQSEPFFGGGTMVKMEGPGLGLRLTMPTDSMAVMLMKFPSWDEDSVSNEYWHGDLSSLALFGIDYARSEGGGRYSSPSNPPPIMTGLQPVVFRRGSDNIIHVHYTLLESGSVDNNGVINLDGNPGVWVSNLLVFDATGVTVSTALDYAYHCMSPHSRSGSPSFTAMAALLGADFLLGESLTMPELPTTNRLGRFHVDGSPASILPDPLCTKVEVWIQDAVPPTTDQTIAVEVNVDTLFSLQLTKATNTLSLAGQSGVITDYTLVKIKFALSGTSHVTVTVVQGTAEVAVLTASIPLTTASSEIARVDVDSGELNIQSAFSEGSFPVLQSAGASQGSELTNPFLLQIGSYGTTSRWQEIMPTYYLYYSHVDRRLAGWQGTALRGYTPSVSGLSLEITTGDFALVLEVTQSMMSAITANRDADTLVSGATGASLTGVKGKTLCTLTALSGGHPLILVADTGGQLHLYTEWGQSAPVATVTMPRGEVVSLMLQRESGVLKLYVNATEVFSVAFTTDLGIQGGNGGLGLISPGQLNNYPGPQTAYLRSIGVFQKALSPAERTDLVNSSQGVPPAQTIKKVYGKFSGVSDGNMWLIREDSGEIFGTATVGSDSRYQFDNFGYAGQFLLIGESADGAKKASAVTLLKGPDTLPAPVLPSDGTTGTYKITGASNLGGARHKGTVYVYRKDTMELLAKRFVFGGDYTVKFDYAGEVRVLALVDTLLHHTVETPATV